MKRRKRKTKPRFCPCCWCAPCGCRPIVGNCSKCGEPREDFYTCRDGGETVAKEA